MFDIKNIKPKTEFTFWFTPIPHSMLNLNLELLVHCRAAVTETDPQGEPVGKVVLVRNYATSLMERGAMIVEFRLDYSVIHEVHPEFSEDSAIDDLLKSDLNDFFKHRPESALFYKPISELFYFHNIELVEFQKAPTAELIGIDTSATADSVFNELLAGAMLSLTSTNGADEHKAIARVAKCITWLNSTDFYIAPGSTQYHDAHPKGLLLHTLRVIESAQKLLESSMFNLVRLDQAIICAAAHDWCKINKYEMYLKNVKDEATGTWNKVPGYKYRDQEIPLGHGETSMFILQRFVPVSVEMACAIRWHMGAWQVHQTAYNELQKSNEKYPLVHLLQFADQLSITDYF